MERLGYVILTCKYHKEGQKWVGVCEELGTSTFADTFEDVQDRLQEAIALHLSTLERVGERERFFKENKIKLYLVKPKEPVCKTVRAASDTYVTPCVHEIRELALA
jgi:predicted RNase H-like HicB family nuclease